MKKIAFIIPVSFIGLALLINLLFGLLSKQYKNDVEMLSMPSGNIDCLLFGGSSLQRQACLRNFNPLKSTATDNDLNVILDGLCSTGNATGCIIKGQLAAINQRIGLTSTTPYNLTWLADNCENSKGQSISDADRLTSCALLKNYAEIASAKITTDFVNQQQCILNPKLCLETLGSNYLFTLEKNYSLSLKNCSYKWKIDDLNKYCEKLDSIIAFQVKLYSLLKSPYLPNVDYTKKFDELCVSNSELCLKIVNQPIFLNALTTLDSKFNIRYFDKFYIHTVGGLFLEDKLSFDKNEAKYENRIFNFLKNKNDNNQIKNLSECLSSEDKSFCFLSVKSLKEATAHKKDLELFCSKEDGISCAYLAIIKNSKILKLDPTKEIYHYFNDYESFVFDFLQNENHSIKYLSFLNLNRYWIISFLLATNLFFIFYFLYAFRGINHVFRYIRERKIKELRDKIDK